MKDNDFYPIVETQTEQQASAVIVSGHRGLAYFLARELEQHGLTVSIVLVKQKILTEAGDFVQRDWDSISDLSQLKSDYLFCLCPTIKSLPGLLDPLFQLCRENQTKLLVMDYFTVEGKSLANHLAQNFKGDYRLAFIAQTFGEWLDGSQNNQTVEKLLLDSLVLGKVELPTDPETPLFLTHFLDIAKGLVLAMFKDASTGSQYFLSNLEKVTSADFGRLLKNSLTEVNRKVELNYVLDGSGLIEPDFKQTAFTQAYLDWYPAFDLKKALPAVIENLAQLYQQAEVSQDGREEFPDIETKSVEPTIVVPLNTQTREIPRVNLSSLQEKGVTVPQLKPLRDTVEGKSEGAKQRRHYGQRLGPFLVAVLILLLVSLPLASFVFASSLGVGQLQESVELLSSGETEAARKTAAAAEVTLGRARGIVSLIRPLVFFNSVGPEKYDRLLDAAGRISGTVELTADTLEQLEDLYGFVTKGEPAIDTAATLQLARANLADLYNQMALISAALERVEFDSRLGYFNNLGKLKRKLPQWQTTVDVGSKTLALLTPVLTGQKPVNILFVIQNSSELRPTGGFIDGVVLATFRNGRLTNTTYQDVFTLDRQLQGFVEPPVGIKKYLGETNWFLRDANWSPDFAESARQILWFYEKETGTKLDGVVGANLFTLRYFLQGLGQQTLPGWSETVSASNLFDKLLQLSKTDPADKSVGEAQYPSLEIAKVLGESISGGVVKLSSLIPALVGSLDENQLLFYFSDPQQTEKVAEFNWGGSLSSKPCYLQFSASGCTSETFAINEANIAINKTNLFLDRSISHLVEIEEKGRVGHVIEVDYRNNAASPSWPEGDYKAFVRFYAPLGSELNEITLNGAVIGLEETRATPFGLTEFSFPLQVRVGEAAKLVLKLRSPNILNTQSPTSALTINWEKQSGTGPEPLRVTVKYPQSLASEAVNLPTVNQADSAQFLVQFKNDQPLATLFRRR